MNATQEVLMDFNEWLNGDDVIKVSSNEYLEQTTGFNKSFTYDELLAFFIREYMS